jgi:thiamine biosynthesis lipoprotein
MKRLTIILGALAAGLVLLHKGLADRPVSTLSGRAMGCDWKLMTRDPIRVPQVRMEIARVLEHWEQVLSTWREDSEISRFNRGQQAGPDLARVIALAERFREETGGAFDHRMLGALSAAGFGPGGSGTDLSSVGKGFAVDRVVERLEGLGIRDFVFSLAGEVRAGSRPWPVVLEAPDPGAAGNATSLQLAGAALATSGNYRNWQRVEDGLLVSHILDPSTGRPVLRPPCSVTVIAPDAATASSWATALFVLGPAASVLAEGRGFRVIWQGRADPAE